MTEAAGENRDRAYCDAALDALRRLEANSFRRNEAARELDRRVQRRGVVYSTVLALILPALTWVWFLATAHGDAEVHTRTVGIVVISVFLFVVVFAVAMVLGGLKIVTPLRARVLRGLTVQHADELAQIDATARRILAEPPLAEGRIPERFLSTRMVSMLLRYFDAGQASFLEAAVYMLDAELRESAYYRNLVPTQTTVSRERDLLARHAAGAA